MPLRRTSFLDEFYEISSAASSDIFALKDELT
jgi:hypothetical protein